VRARDEIRTRDPHVGNVPRLRLTNKKNHTANPNLPIIPQTKTPEMGFLF